MVDAYWGMLPEFKPASKGSAKAREEVDCDNGTMVADFGGTCGCIDGGKTGSGEEGKASTAAADGDGAGAAKSIPPSIPGN
mmetsp:Transcript_44873/g.66602  ORF Transcript_44873/g.66602 Transcript_44873/m.66602 type:complete len:81 (+) Transcript_44873:501-743(+)